MLNNDFLNKFFLFIYSFLYIFNPGNFFSFNILYILAFISFVYIYLTKDFFINFLSNKRIFYLILICFIFFSYLTTSYLLGNDDALLRGYSFIVLVLSLLVAYTIIYIYSQIYPLKLSSLIKFILMISIFQLLFVYLAVLSPNFRAWTLLTARQTDIFDISNDVGSGLRSFGLSSGYTSSFPMFMGICGFFSLYLFSISKLISKKIFYIFITVLIVFSIIINARIGLIPIIMWFVISPFYLFSKADFRALTAFSLIFISLWLIPSKAITNSDYLFRFFQGLEELENLSNGNSTGTFENLSNMWFFPDDIFGLLFGEGKKILGANPQGSDIGFIQDIYMYGLIPTTILGGFLLYLIYPFLNLAKKDSGIFFIIILMSTLIIFYLKGMCFYANEVVNFCFLLICFCVFKDIRDKKVSN